MVALVQYYIPGVIGAALDWCKLKGRMIHSAHPGWRYVTSPSAHGAPNTIMNYSLLFFHTTILPNRITRKIEHISSQI